MKVLRNHGPIRKLVSFRLSACQTKSRGLEAVSELVRLIMPSDPVHGWGHVERVVETACRIAGGYEGVDYEVLLLAAYLHDIGRLSEPENHAVRSASIARHVLKMLGYPEDKIERVVEAVLAHSYSLGYAATSMEAKILSDADRLDALGSIGLVRVLMYSGELGRDLSEAIDHIRVKLLKLPETMYTSEGRAEAERRVKAIRAFLEDLLNELGGPPR